MTVICQWLIQRRWSWKRRSQNLLCALHQNSENDKAKVKTRERRRCFKIVIIPPPTCSSGRRYSVFQQKFLSFFFSFAKGSSRWLYRQATFIAQKVGYRCNFVKLVRNLGADPPLKFGGPKTPNFGQFSDDLRLCRSTAPEKNKISTIWKWTFKVLTFLCQVVKQWFTSVHYELRDWS